MKSIKSQNIKNNFDTLDLVEDIINRNDWDYERDKNKNIHVEVSGDWCDYQLSYGINEDIKLIYISCALDLKIPENRMKNPAPILPAMPVRKSIIYLP